MRYLLAVLLFAHLTTLAAQADPLAYRLFDERGKRTKYGKLLRAAVGADVVLFGESHNNPIAHWLQNRLARDLAGARGDLTVGMEMFETDQQGVLNDYLAGRAELKNVNAVGEGLWSNFRTDYQPLVDWAKARGYPVVATNTPRRFARQVFRQGFGVATARGTEHSDTFAEDGQGGVTTTTNHHGGMLGGISSGRPVVLRAAVKPTSSIPQDRPIVVDCNGGHSSAIAASLLTKLYAGRTRVYDLGAAAKDYKPAK